MRILSCCRSSHYLIYSAQERELVASCLLTVYCLEFSLHFIVCNYVNAGVQCKITVTLTHIQGNSASLSIELIILMVWCFCLQKNHQSLKKVNIFLKNHCINILVLKFRVFLSLIFILLIFFFPGAPSKPCDSNPCQHGSTCHSDDAPDKFTCICLPDFVGELCEISKDDGI